MKPYDWQEHDLEVLEQNNFTALVNIQTGGGKTPLAVWAGLRSGAEQVLIVAPLNTHESAWGKTLKQLTDVELRLIGNKNKEQRQALQDMVAGVPGWFISTPHLMGHAKTDIKDWKPDMLISDEVHMFNRPGGKFAKRWIQLGAQSSMRLALSGTPARRSFGRMWTNMRHLWPELDSRGEVAHKNEWVWRQDRMTSEKIWTGQRDYFGKPKQATRWLAEKEPGKLISEAPCVVQHFRRDECCFWHPEGFLEFDKPLVLERVVSLLPEQKKIIRQLEREMMAWLDDNPLIVSIPLEKRNRIKQVCLGVPTLEDYLVENSDGIMEVKQTLRFEPDCKSPVVDEVIDILDHLDEGEPVLVHLESQRFASVLTERLNRAGYSAAEFSGVTSKKRDEFLSRFGKDIQVIVGVTSAISNGTDGLQEVCSTEIFAETHIDDTLVEQSEARIDRIGSGKQAVRYVIVDDLGYAKGQLSDQLEKRLAINKSTRRVL